MKTLNKITAAAIITFSACFASAQDDNDIIIVTNANRSVEPASRLTDSPKIKDTVFAIPTTNYPLLAINYEPSFDLQRIAPATVNLNQKYFYSHNK